MTVQLLLPLAGHPKYYKESGLALGSFFVLDPTQLLLWLAKNASYLQEEER